MTGVSAVLLWLFVIDLGIAAGRPVHGVRAQ